MWEVSHGRSAPYYDEQIKHIGIFSTRQNARAAVAYLKAKSGFSKPGGRFFVESCRRNLVEYRIRYLEWGQGQVRSLNEPGVAINPFAQRFDALPCMRMTCFSD